MFILFTNSQKKLRKKVKFDRLLLPLILGSALIIKIPTLLEPLVGHFGSYQTVTAMVASMMTRGTIKAFLIPETFIIVDGAPAVRLLDYPVASFLVAVAKLCLGGEIDFWGRFQAAIFMLGAGWLLYAIARKYFDRTVALLAVLIFSFSPMVLISGLSFQNEAAAVFFLLLSFWMLCVSSSGRMKFASGLIFSFALVARLHFALTLPGFLLAITQQKRTVPALFLFVLGMMLPASLWYGYAYCLSVTHGNILTSLFSQVGEGRILFHPLLLTTEFYGRVFEILAGFFLTPILTPFLAAGLLRWSSPERPFVLWGICALSAILILPQKVFDQPFYLIMSVPATSILCAPVLRRFLAVSKRVVQIGFFITFAVSSMRYFLPPALSPMQEAAKKIPVIGQHVQTISAKDDWIIAAHGSSPELLYYSRRFGWPFDIAMTSKPVTTMPNRLRAAWEYGYGDPIAWLEHLRHQGAKYLVVAEPERFWEREEFATYVTGHYNQLKLRDDSFLMFDLGR